MTEPDIRDLARLHTTCLTDSVVGALGERYVRSFYRYVTRSPKELLFVDRNAAGVIVAATVVSLEPHTLNRRLALGTPLVLALALHAYSMTKLLWPRGAASGGRAHSDAHQSLPEMILIFAAPGERGGGRGSTLVERAEAGLRTRGVTQYQVMTVCDPSNRALAFYRDRGFVPAGTLVRLGKYFQVFTRRIGNTKP
jgi:GNAT superfamily N-acetyltransferase